MKVKIYVEGVADAKFIQDLIKYWYQADLIIGKPDGGISDILIVDGKDKLIKSKPLFEQNYDSNIKSIVIFDADTFEIESKVFENYRLEFPIEHFLLPDNQSDGDLETLLEKIINPKNIAIFECWDAYEKCLRLYPKNNFTTPARKTKIYAYLEALLGESKNQKKLIKEAERDYQTPNHWNLDSPALHNLKQFLNTYFLENND